MKNNDSHLSSFSRDVKLKTDKSLKLMKMVIKMHQIKRKSQQHLKIFLLHVIKMIESFERMMAWLNKYKQIKRLAMGLGFLSFFVGLYFFSFYVIFDGGKCEEVVISHRPDAPQIQQFKEEQGITAYEERNENSYWKRRVSHSAN